MDPAVAELSAHELTPFEQAVLGARWYREAFDLFMDRVQASGSLEGLDVLLTHPGLVDSVGDVGAALAELAATELVPAAEVSRRVRGLDLAQQVRFVTGLFGHREPLRTPGSFSSLWDLLPVAHAAVDGAGVLGALDGEAAVVFAGSTLLRLGYRCPNGQVPDDLGAAGAAVAVLSAAGPAVVRRVALLDRQFRVFDSQQVLAGGPWLDVRLREVPEVPVELADRWAVSSLPWLSAFGLRVGASGPARAAAVALHGPRILLAGGERGFVQDELRLLAPLVGGDCGALAGFSVTIVRIVGVLMGSPPKDRSYPALLGGLVFSGGIEPPALTDSLLQFVWNERGWSLSEEQVAKLAQLDVCRASLLFLRGVDGPVSDHLRWWLLHLRGMPGAMFTQPESVRWLLDRFVRAEASRCGVAVDAVLTGVRGWSGSLAELLETLAIVDEVSDVACTDAT